MTESEILIAEAHKIAMAIDATHPALCRFLLRLTDKYAESIADTLRLENHPPNDKVSLG